VVPAFDGHLPGTSIPEKVEGPRPVLKHQIRSRP
jgi:hypothetical protein